MLKNKKGFFSVFNIVALFIILLIMVSLMAVREAGVEKEKIFDALDNISIKYQNQSYYSADEPLINVVYATVNYVLYSSIQLSKLAIVIGTENVEFSPRMIINLLILCLLAPLIIPLVKLIIIIVILLNEWRFRRKEKKLIIQFKKEGKKTQWQH